MEFFLCVVGMVLVIEGFPYAAFPRSVKAWLKTILGIRAGALRGFGLLMMLVGVFLVYMAKGRG
ncbi:DUF2065 domain-containing protein [Desulfonema ishimotonii]|uniref:DUF2065 domain-containing protein n=2 Tax=Desulfonema ishimotonii TaxID=45657 RepID=A0A401G3P0_9BACT|nr:DUF2065 domain-containing protein [Desulfonema ishimotonii]